MNDTPPIEWFEGGIIERNKFDAYLLSPTHPKGKNKLRLWQSIFGIGPGDGALLEMLIREQLVQAKPKEMTKTEAVRRWELVVPCFRGPNGNVAPVRTGWALEPGRDRPHLTTAFPLKSD